MQHVASTTNDSSDHRCKLACPGELSSRALSSDASELEDHLPELLGHLQHEEEDVDVDEDGVEDEVLLSGVVQDAGLRDEDHPDAEDREEDRLEHEVEEGVVREDQGDLEVDERG